MRTQELTWPCQQTQDERWILQAKGGTKVVTVEKDGAVKSGKGIYIRRGVGGTF